jgi:hypothetical protein
VRLSDQSERQYRSNLNTNIGQTEHGPGEFSSLLSAVARSGLAATPDHPDLLEAAGTAIWWLGDRKEGEKLLTRARDLRPWLNRKPVRAIPRAKIKMNSPR